MKKKLKPMLNVVLYGIIFTLLALSVPKIFGCNWVAITSGSMLPTLPVGCACLVKDTPGEEIRKDDIITFALPESNALVTHRVRSINSDRTFVTQGDNNDRHDTKPVHPDNVQGVVIAHIPFLGYALRVLVVPWMKLMMVGIICLLCVATAKVSDGSDTLTDSFEDGDTSKPELVISKDMNRSFEGKLSASEEPPAIDFEDDEDENEFKIMDTVNENGGLDTNSDFLETNPSVAEEKASINQGEDPRSLQLKAQTFETLSELSTFCSSVLKVPEALAVSIAYRAVQSTVSPEYHIELAVRMFSKLFNEGRI